MSRFRSQDYADGWLMGAGQVCITWLVLLVLVSLFGCGATITGPKPCTAENADQIQYDHKGRPVMYVCF